MAEENRKKLTPESPALKPAGPTLKPSKEQQAMAVEFMKAAINAQNTHQAGPSPKAISQARFNRNMTSHFQQNPTSAFVIGLIQKNSGNTNRANLQYQRMLTNMNQLSPAQRSILSQMDPSAQANVLNMNPGRLKNAINNFSAQSQLKNAGQLNLSNELTAQLSAMYNPNDINMMNYVAEQASILAAEEEEQTEDLKQDNDKTAELEKGLSPEPALEKTLTPEPKPEQTAELEKAAEFKLFDDSENIKPQPDHKSFLEKVKERLLSPKTEVAAGLEATHKMETPSPLNTRMGG